MKKYSFLLLLSLFSTCLYAGKTTTTTEKKDLHQNNFIEFQLQFERVKQAYNQYYNKITSEFNQAKLPFPPKEIYIRSFKWNKTLEVWIRLENQDTFIHYRTFRICQNSGELGPKRKEGDLQVPEGSYYITDFNPKSNYFLSLLVSYPNYSDQQMGYKADLGGDIYLHGSCTTVGCIPLTDDGIKELYLLCMLAKANGQNNIPVHIFPVRFNPEGLLYIGKNYKDNIPLLNFWLSLKTVYDYFESTHKIPFIMYDENGNYLCDDAE